MENVKKLYRSDKDKVLSGIVGGLGEYFQIDSVLLRLVIFFVVMITGFFPGVIAYVIALLIVPKSITSPVSPVNEKTA